MAKSLMPKFDFYCTGRGTHKYRKAVTFLAEWPRHAVADAFYVAGQEEEHYRFMRFESLDSDPVPPSEMFVAEVLEERYVSAEEQLLRDIFQDKTDSVDPEWFGCKLGTRAPHWGLVRQVGKPRPEVKDIIDEAVLKSTRMDNTYSWGNNTHSEAYFYSDRDLSLLPPDLRDKPKNELSHVLKYKRESKAKVWDFDCPSCSIHVRSTRFTSIAAKLYTNGVKSLDVSTVRGIF